MFKRKPRSYSQIATEMVYPRGGWSRAVQYLVHRIRRLPDQPHRVGRGFAAGTFVSFTPLFGIHLLGGMALAWAIRGNVLAGVLGTLVGNPVTIPFIAVMSVGLGRWILGIEGSAAPRAILDEFGAAGSQLAHNMLSLFDGRTAEWDRLAHFAQTILWPYFVGGLIPGLIAAVAGHYLTVPLVRAYHKRRAAQMARRIAALRARPPAAAPGAGPDDAH